MGIAQNGFMNAFMSGNPNYERRPTTPAVGYGQGPWTDALIRGGAQTPGPQPPGYQPQPWKSWGQPWQPGGGQTGGSNMWTNPITGAQTPIGGGGGGQPSGGHQWGVSQPGMMYPAVEGPGNPSWEARNPQFRNGGWNPGPSWQPGGGGQMGTSPYMPGEAGYMNGGGQDWQRMLGQMMGGQFGGGGGKPGGPPSMGQGQTAIGGPYPQPKGQMMRPPGTGPYYPGEKPGTSRPPSGGGKPGGPPMNTIGGPGMPPGGWES